MGASFPMEMSIGHSRMAGQSYPRRGQTGGPPEKCTVWRSYARIVGAWVIVIVCAWERDSLVRGAR